ncbi:hypothetical protein [Serratia marcescens]|uniref:hypothetical protein n=1 Tax=Serratia marcescens TaxID=615 RepID=UPI001D00604A|nr:hypothetical protein [Serratia marcescens]
MDRHPAAQRRRGLFYAAPKNLSHFVVSLVVVGAILLWTHKLLRFFFAEKFEKKPR